MRRAHLADELVQGGPLRFGEPVANADHAAQCRGTNAFGTDQLEKQGRQMNAHFMERMEQHETRKVANERVAGSCHLDHGSHLYLRGQKVELCHDMVHQLEGIILTLGRQVFEQTIKIRLALGCHETAVVFGKLLALGGDLGMYLQPGFVQRSSQVRLHAGIHLDLEGPGSHLLLNALGGGEGPLPVSIDGVPDLRQRELEQRKARLVVCADLAFGPVWSVFLEQKGEQGVGHKRVLPDYLLGSQVGLFPASFALHAVTPDNGPHERPGILHESLRALIPRSAHGLPFACFLIPQGVSRLRRHCSASLGCKHAAFLVLLARAAWAGLVAPDLGATLISRPRPRKRRRGGKILHALDLPRGFERRTRVPFPVYLFLEHHIMALQARQISGVRVDNIQEESHQVLRMLGLPVQGVKKRPRVIFPGIKPQIDGRQYPVLPFIEHHYHYPAAIAVLLIAIKLDKSVLTRWKRSEITPPEYRDHAGFFFANILEFLKERAQVVTPLSCLSILVLIPSGHASGLHFATIGRLDPVLPTGFGNIAG